MRRIEPLAFTCAVNSEALSRWRGLIGGELNSMCVTTLVPSSSKDCSIGLDGPHCISVLAPSMSPEFEIPKLCPKTDFIDYGEGVSRRVHARALTFGFIEQRFVRGSGKARTEPNRKLNAGLGACLKRGIGS